MDISQWQLMDDSDGCSLPTVMPRDVAENLAAAMRTLGFGCNAIHPTASLQSDEDWTVKFDKATDFDAAQAAVNNWALQK